MCLIFFEKYKVDLIKSRTELNLNLALYSGSFFAKVQIANMLYTSFSGKQYLFLEVQLSNVFFVGNWFI